MAPTNIIELRAKAKQKGIEGYRTMSLSELQAALKGGAAKSSTNGASAGRKSAGRKSTPKATVTKTAGRKSAKSAPAAKSAKAGKAKRPTAGGTRKSAVRNTPTKPKATRATSTATSGVRSRIVDGDIDWTAEWNGGQDGNRGTIMKLLRKFKGNSDKVFNALADKAKTMYPKQPNGRARSKDDAQRLLRWHINRIKFDFVTATEQHVTGGGSKPAGRRQSAPKAKAKANTGRKTGTRQKAAQGRAGAKKTAAGRKRK